MHSVFGDVIWIVSGVGLVIGLIALTGTGKAWEEFGKRGLLMERERDAGRGGGPPAGSAAALAERDDEIRQMLEAGNARRERRGQAPLDIATELRRLTAPQIDPGLRQEIRQMVVARNYRRVRRGQEPLDVEAEIERQIADLERL
jgi:hypothetical protein